MSDVLFMCRPELAQNLFGFVGRMAIARQLIDRSALCGQSLLCLRRRGVLPSLAGSRGATFTPPQLGQNSASHSAAGFADFKPHFRGGPLGLDAAHMRNRAYTSKQPVPVPRPPPARPGTKLAIPSAKGAGPLRFIPQNGPVAVKRKPNAAASLGG